MSKHVFAAWKKVKSLITTPARADGIICPSCSTVLNRTLMFNSAPRCHICGAVINLKEVPPLADT